jgi:CBS domain-containing protein
MICDVETASPETPVGEAARAMARHQVGCLPVVDRLRRVVGMVTDRDLTLRVLAQGLDPIRTRVEEVMSHPVITGFEDELPGQLEETMLREGVWRLPVLGRDGRLVGLVVAKAAALCPDRAR